jgi:hypothetical protein
LERLAIAQKYGDAITGALIDPVKLQGLVDQNDSIRARGLAAGGDQKGADLLNFDIRARQELASFSNSWKDVYGDAYAANVDYQASLTQLETVQGSERLAIIKKYGEAANGATESQVKSAQQAVASVFGDISAYVAKLGTTDKSPLSPLGQYDYAKGQFNAVAGAASAGDAQSLQKFTSYADTFLTASRAVNGSGAQYAADFNRVLDAATQILNVPTETVTQSFLTLQLRDVKDGIVDKLDELNNNITQVRRELQLQTKLRAA